MVRETLVTRASDKAAPLGGRKAGNKRPISEDGGAVATRRIAHSGPHLTAEATAGPIRLRDIMRADDRPATTARKREQFPDVDVRALELSGWEAQHDGPHGSVGWHHPRHGWIWSRQVMKASGGFGAGGDRRGAFRWFALPNGMLSVATLGPFTTIDAARRALEQPVRSA